MPASIRRAAVCFVAIVALCCSYQKTPDSHPRPPGNEPARPDSGVQERGTPLTVAIDVRDGSRIVGTPLVTGFTLRSRFGPLAFPLDQVASMRFSDTAGGVRIEFRNGDVLTGSVEADSFPVRFAAGEMTLPVSAILCVTTGSPVALLAGGLVAHYPLRGNTADATGHGYNALNYGAVPAPGRSGIEGGAMEFNGADAHINLPEGLVDPEGAACTLSLWVLAKSSRGTHEALYIGAATAELSMWGENGSIRFGIGLTDGRWHTVDAALPENTFVHITGVYVRGKSVRLYVNGERKSDAPLPNFPLRAGLPEYSSGIGTYAPEHPEHGRRFGMANWSGRIGDVRIYNRALTDEEIMLLAHATD